MKNVIFWTGVKNNSPNMVEKYGGYEWMNISKKSWEYWCEKNNCIFFHYETPNKKDLIEYRVTWQRWFDVFDQLEKNNIDYDKIFLVDACSIVKWNCPNFFELCDDRMTAWLDKDNWGWIYESVIGYQDFFKSHAKHLTSRYLVNNYINAGAVIVNKKHKNLFKKFKEFYETNKKELIYLQDKQVLKGTDQTPFNYWLQINKVDINTSLPFMYNLTHMHRKNMLINNWQLNEPVDLQKEEGLPHFIKHGYIWKYNGIPKNNRTELMTQTWNVVSSLYKTNYNFNELIKNFPDKHEHNKTTSLLFKQHLFNFFSNIDTSKMKVLELGTSHGHTTKILAALFDKVTTIDISNSNLQKARIVNEDMQNIKYYNIDVYKEQWPQDNFDVFLIDCVHTYESVKHDILYALMYAEKKQIYLVLDDYGSIEEVKKAVDNLVEQGKIKIVSEIGHPSGTSWPTRAGHVLNGPEGVICTNLEVV